MREFKNGSFKSWTLREPSQNQRFLLCQCLVRKKLLQMLRQEFLFKGQPYPGSGTAHICLDFTHVLNVPEGKQTKSTTMFIRKPDSLVAHHTAFSVKHAKNCWTATSEKKIPRPQVQSKNLTNTNKSHIKKKLGGCLLKILKHMFVGTVVTCSSSRTRAYFIFAIIISCVTAHQIFGLGFWGSR